MAAGDSKGKEKVKKPATATSSRGRNTRTDKVAKKNQLKQSKEAKTIERSSKKKEFEKLTRNIRKLQTQLDEEEDDESKSKLGEELKTLQSKAAEAERKLKEIESEIEKILSNEARLERGEPMELDDGEVDNGEEGTSETEEDQEMGGSERRRDNETESNENVEPGQERNNTNSAADTASPMPPDPEIVPPSGANASADIRGSAEDILDRDNPRDFTELPVSQGDEFDHPQGLASDPENDRAPEDFDDFNLPTVTEQNQYSTGFSLDNGKVILHARSHKLALISYGPKYSAMLIWSKNGATAAEKLKKVTNLLGAPHDKAMERDEETDTLKYKGRIGPIKAIAWLPKRGGDTMLGILDSVEELNPIRKEQRERYIYPFSCVLVELEGCLTAKGDKNQSVWIDRSKYKALCSSGKDSSARTDRKFYEMGCLQVKRFRDWAGNKLDPTWAGVYRRGDERSPTPLEETPEPDYADQGTQDQAAQNQAAQNQAAQNQAAQNQAAQNQTAQGQTAQNQTAQNQASEETSGEQQATAESSSESIKDFYEIYLEKKNVDPNIPWKELDDKIFASFIAAAKIYIKELKDGGAEVRDDMGLGRTFQKMANH
ncbi:uncharacterized protein N7469_001893 [Penicillium citrinum]|uniref:Uncharacterized protein n=1 Tax=Penicillium citrinum TaxID=5077 RepID=A0A9W9P9I3_PENCI|nr:uncharacterized protein N7469_001893 [Penicillium citrinum]KAJ5240302.1 hypothetical protein N7469_001893 [Penicillium citrinum]